MVTRETTNTSVLTLHATGRTHPSTGRPVVSTIRNRCQVLNDRRTWRPAIGEPGWVGRHIASPFVPAKHRQQWMNWNTSVVKSHLSCVATYPATWNKLNYLATVQASPRDIHNSISLDVKQFSNRSFASLVSRGETTLDARSGVPLRGSLHASTSKHRMVHMKWINSGALGSWMWGFNFAWNVSMRNIFTSFAPLNWNPKTPPFAPTDISVSVWNVKVKTICHRQKKTSFMPFFCNKIRTTRLQANLNFWKTSMKSFGGGGLDLILNIPSAGEQRSKSINVTLWNFQGQIYTSWACTLWRPRGSCTVPS